MEILPTPKTDEPLDDAMQEILEVMRRADLAGSVVLISNESSQYALEIPKWTSCSLGTKKGEDAGMLRMKATREEFETQADFNEALQLLAHFVFQMRDLNKGMADTFEMSVTKLQEFLQMEQEKDG